MANKPGRIYRYADKRPYTRQEYVGGIPASKIVSYDMGNVKGDFEVELSLVVKEDVQITHSALEAGRISANRYLNKMLGSANYHFKVRVHPHQILRENKMASGAGADRISQGMSLAFGKAVGRAARVRRGQRVFTVRVQRGNFAVAKDALRRAAMKIPCGSAVRID
ncbi:MAG: 50S ribosomal protein L16, partial [Methanobacteriota archaeon]